MHVRVCAHVLVIVVIRWVGVRMHAQAHTRAAYLYVCSPVTGSGADLTHRDSEAGVPSDTAMLTAPSAGVPLPFVSQLSCARVPL